METKMEAATRAAPPNFASLAKAVTKILRFRRGAAGSGGIGAVPDDADDLRKLKLSQPLDGYSAIPSKLPGDTNENEKKVAIPNREAMESVLANLFAGVSAVKAAYAQLQVAQSPYDPESIQSADEALVTELKRLSELKQSYLKRQLLPLPVLAAEIEELGNLLKTYQITARKLEAELECKDSETLLLESRLMASEKKNRAFEARLHPGRSLAALDDLHVSGLNPAHFLVALRYTVKSVRSFAKQLVQELESAGWDLDAAADAIHPGVRRRKVAHRVFAFESYVCQKLFSNFQHRDFGLCAFADRHSWDRRRFFEEFAELKRVKPGHFLERIAKFCRAKYLGLVHPKMEASLNGNGNLEQRAVVSAGPGFPDSKLFDGFAEMARRVWLLHCLFFAFEPEGNAANIFQARRGCRFSEVFMESVADDGGDEAGNRPSVGFTVVPGFRVGRTVIQCKVYLSDGPDVS